MGGQKQSADLILDLAAEPNPLDVAILERGLFHYEETRLGSPRQAHYSIFLRDAAGDIRGGVDAHVMWQRLFVKTVWITERLRGQGYGTSLMGAAEAEAIRRHCRSIWLTALGERACGFYMRLGFTIYGTHEDYVGGQDLFSLRKDL